MKKTIAKSDVESLRPTIGFYGLTPTASGLRNCYLAIIDWFEFLGMQPRLITVRAPGFGRKWIGFKNANKRMQGANFSEVASFSLVASPSNRGFAPADYYLAADFSLQAGLSVSVIDSLARLHSDSMRRIASSIVAHTAPAYGIGFQKPGKRAPSLYVVGLGYLHEGAKTKRERSAAERLDATRSSRWSHTAIDAKVWERGLLRDLYPWNFLTAPHLTATVGDLQLKRWIEADPGRGTLSQMENGVVLWEIAESAMPGIRDVLFDAGRIYDWPNVV